MAQKKDTKEKEQKDDVRTLRIAPPSLDIVEMRIKSVKGSSLFMESKKGAEAFLFEQYGESMDPTRNPTSGYRRRPTSIMAGDISIAIVVRP